MLRAPVWFVVLHIFIIFKATFNGLWSNKIDRDDNDSDNDNDNDNVKKLLRYM